MRFIYIEDTNGFGPTPSQGGGTIERFLERCPSSIILFHHEDYYAISRHPCAEIAFLLRRCPVGARIITGNVGSGTFTYFSIALRKDFLLSPAKWRTPSSVPGASSLWSG